jgi:hypothetical protein
VRMLLRGGDHGCVCVGKRVQRPRQGPARGDGGWGQAQRHNKARTGRPGDWRATAHAAVGKAPDPHPPAGQRRTSAVAAPAPHLALQQQRRLPPRQRELWLSLGLVPLQELRPLILLILPGQPGATREVEQGWGALP